MSIWWITALVMIARVFLHNDDRNKGSGTNRNPPPTYKRPPPPPPIPPQRK